MIPCESFVYGGLQFGLGCPDFGEVRFGAFVTPSPALAVGGGGGSSLAGGAGGSSVVGTAVEAPSEEGDSVTPTTASADFAAGSRWMSRAPKIKPKTNATATIATGAATSVQRGGDGFRATCPLVDVRLG